MQVGDLISKHGIFTEPGVVIGKKMNGDYVVSTDKEAVAYFHRYTNTTGLSPDEKNEFNAILDQIYNNKADDREKINAIQQEIDRLKTDPSKKKMIHYLKNQQSHLIRTTKTLPNVYTISQDETKIPMKTIGGKENQEEDSKQTNTKV